MEDRLLGFDARELWLSPDDLWDAQRKETFLLRFDVGKPLSIDTLVWPSLFDTGQGIGLHKAERARLQLAGIPVPAYIGANAGLWDSLAAARSYLAEHWAKP